MPGVIRGVMPKLSMICGAMPKDTIRGVMPKIRGVMPKMLILRGVMPIVRGAMPEITLLTKTYMKIILDGQTTEGYENG